MLRSLNALLPDAPGRASCRLHSGTPLDLPHDPPSPQAVSNSQKFWRSLSPSGSGTGSSSRRSSRSHWRKRGRQKHIGQHCDWRILSRLRGDPAGWKTSPVLQSPPSRCRGHCGSPPGGGSFRRIECRRKYVAGARPGEGFNRPDLLARHLRESLPGDIGYGRIL